jgi:hypothetical protein
MTHHIGLHDLERLSTLVLVAALLVAAPGVAQAGIATSPLGVQSGPTATIVDAGLEIGAIHSLDVLPATSLAAAAADEPLDFILNPAMAQQLGARLAAQAHQELIRVQVRAFDAAKAQGLEPAVIEDMMVRMAAEIAAIMAEVDAMIQQMFELGVCHNAIVAVGGAFVLGVSASLAAAYLYDEYLKKDETEECSCPDPDDEGDEEESGESEDRYNDGYNDGYDQCQDDQGEEGTGEDFWHEPDFDPRDIVVSEHLGAVLSRVHLDLRTMQYLRTVSKGTMSLRAITRDYGLAITP